MSPMKDQLEAIRDKIPKASFEANDEERRLLVANQIQLGRAEIRLAQAKTKKELAATAQSIAMAVLTGLSSIVVVFSFWKGSRPLPPTTIPSQRQ